MITDRQNTSPEITDGSKFRPIQSKKVQEKKGKGGSLKKMTAKEQSAQFIKTAREHEVDESGLDFEKAIEAVVPRKSQ